MGDIQVICDSIVTIAGIIGVVFVIKILFEQEW